MKPGDRTAPTTWIWNFLIFSNAIFTFALGNAFSIIKAFTFLRALFRVKPDTFTRPTDGINIFIMQIQF